MSTTAELREQWNSIIAPGVGISRQQIAEFVDPLIDELEQTRRMNDLISDSHVRGLEQLASTERALKQSMADAIDAVKFAMTSARAAALEEAVAVAKSFRQHDKHLAGPAWNAAIGQVVHAIRALAATPESTDGRHLKDVWGAE